MTQSVIAARVEATRVSALDGSLDIVGALSNVTPAPAVRPSVCPVRTADCITDSLRVLDGAKVASVLARSVIDPSFPLSWISPHVGQSVVIDNEGLQSSAKVSASSFRPLEV